MRVISGKYKGLKLIGYDVEGTRATQSHVKESLFAMISSDIKDAVVLDLFAGSGSLGIECLSNYASKCYFVDNNKECIKNIKHNLSKIDNAEVLNMDYMQGLKRLNDVKFDIILLDPPYNMDILTNIIKVIEENNMLNEDGIIVCEYEKNEPISRYNDYKYRKYGKKNVKIYKNIV